MIHCCSSACGNPRSSLEIQHIIRCERIVFMSAKETAAREEQPHHAIGPTHQSKSSKSPSSTYSPTVSPSPTVDFLASSVLDDVNATQKHASNETISAIDSYAIISGASQSDHEAEDTPDHNKLASLAVLFPLAVLVVGGVFYRRKCTQQATDTVRSFL